MDFEQILTTSIFVAIAVAITWVGCAVIACFHTDLRKGFGRAPLSALATCATTYALGATWQGCGSWNALFIPFVGAVVFGALGATIPARAGWNAAFIALRIALPLAALAIGPQLPVWQNGCSL